MAFPELLGKKHASNLGAGTGSELASLDLLHRTLTLGNGSGLLGKDNLDVRGRGLEGVDAAVSAVHAAAHLGGSVDLNVRDNEGGGVDGLGIGVGLGVAEEGEEVLAHLDGPTTHVSAVLLSLSVAAETTTVGEGMKERRRIKGK